MARAKKRSRFVLTTAVGLLIAGALAAAFWPRPTMVDLAEVTRGSMMVTINEEGRTRVSEAYVVSTPVAGRLQRVAVDPGDAVVRGETTVAHMLPTNPAALDIRTREQALSAVQAAQAAVRVAHADLNAAKASEDFVAGELQRTESLAQRGITSEAALQRARQEFRVTQATVETAEAAIAMREADLANTQAQLIGFDDQGLASVLDGQHSDDIPLYAPATGRILRIIQQSETTLPAGAPIMEIGDVEGDLEVVVDLISSDAVQVGQGDRVIIEDWGGTDALAGEIVRIDPFGITKTSALGVEEQRVPVTIALSSPAPDRSGLGHGYRVEVRIVVWEAADVLRVPSSALFRVNDKWAVFVENEGLADLREIEIGRDNGVTAEVLGGLEAGVQVVIYPSAAVQTGSAIAKRVVQ